MSDNKSFQDKLKVEAKNVVRVKDTVPSNDVVNFKPSDKGSTNDLEGEPIASHREGEKNVTTEHKLTNEENLAVDAGVEMLILEAKVDFLFKKMLELLSLWETQGFTKRNMIEIRDSITDYVENQ